MEKPGAITIAKACSSKEVHLLKQCKAEWVDYWNRSRQKDNAGIVFMRDVLEHWGYNLVQEKSATALSTMDALEVIEMIEARFQAEGIAPMERCLQSLIKQKNKMIFDLSKDGNGYKGIADIVRPMENQLAKVATMFGDDFHKVEDDNRVATAFCEMLGDAPFKEKVMV